MTLRLFVGFPFPEPAVEAAVQLSDAFSHPEIRWTRRENLHLTAYFFGKWEEEALPNLIACLSLITRKQTGFTLQLRDICLAPPGKQPRMIWARYQPHRQFSALVMDLQAMFQQLEPNHQVRHKPTPHVTLARLRQGDAGKKLPEIRASRDWEMPCEELVLWRSDLHPQGAVYTPLARWSLAH